MSRLEIRIAPAERAKLAARARQALVRANKRRRLRADCYMVRGAAAAKLGLEMKPVW